MVLKNSIMVLSVVLQLARPAPAHAAPEPESGTEIRIEPSEVEADSFFHGASVHVDAIVPPGWDVAVLCTGKEETLELKKRGKAMGVLWMNVGEVAFDSVPSVYQLSTSDKLSKLAGPGVQEEFGLGYRALEAKAFPDPGDGERRRLFGELIRLKESEGLFSVAEGSAELRVQSLSVHVSARFRLPAKTPPGDYEVRLVGFRDGKARLLGSERLRLSQVGLTALISSLAQRHGLLYGVFAVVIALGVGLVTGLLFGLGSKKGH